MTFNRFVSAILWLVSASGLASAQDKRDAEAGIVVAHISAYIEQCKQVDELLRSTCARSGPNPPDSVRKICQLPAQTFAARTERRYLEFKQSWREEIQKNEASTAQSAQLARDGFERHFGHMRRGSFSAFDVELLDRELRDCVKAETRWLDARKEKR
jgi:hypothetical protein